HAVDLAREGGAGEELAAGRLDQELALDVEALTGLAVLVAGHLDPTIGGEIRLPDGGPDRRRPRPAHLLALLDEGDEALVVGRRLGDGQPAQALGLLLSFTDEGLGVSHAGRSCGPGAQAAPGCRLGSAWLGAGSEWPHGAAPRSQ